MTIDDDFLSQFPSMYGKTKKLGVIIPMSKSLDRQHKMPVLEAELLLKSGVAEQDLFDEKKKGEVLVQKRSRNGELETYNPLHYKNLKSQKRM